jgi:hypothetical protein
VPNFVQDIVGEAGHSGKPLAVIARQIVTEQSEDHDDDHNGKHIFFEHGFSAARKTVGGERFRRHKVQQPGEFNSTVVSLIDLIGHQPSPHSEAGQPPE